ncbi:MAG: DUF6291 domain-containing protein [Victivallaceae bacterium]|jgi:hypothetical protein
MDGKKLQAFQIHAETAELLEEMEPQQAGLMIQAMCKYHFFGDAEWLRDKTLRLAFVLIRGRMDRDAAAYADKCAKNRANILERYKPGPETPRETVRTNTDEYDRIPKGTKSTNPDPKPKGSKEPEKSARAAVPKNNYPAWMEGELLTEFEGFLAVYEATHGKKPHPGQMEEIILDLTRITAAERLQSVKQSKKYGQKTIHDHRKFQKGRQESGVRTGERKASGFGIRG